VASILVTGGAGFIGSHLCEHLLRRGHHITIVDSLDDFYAPQLKLANLDEVRRAGAFEFFPVDIRDTGRLQEVFEKTRPEAVVHLAARAGVRASLLHPDLYVSVNVQGTLNLLELSRKNGVQRLVFASSSSVYGQPNHVPFSENDPVTKPLSVYGATKISGEALGFAYAHLYPLSLVCLRIFTAFGPRQRPDLAIRKFAHLIEANKEVPLFGDGSMQRDYTYIDDVVTTFERALEYNCSFEIFNLGNSRPVRLDYMVQTLEEALGMKAVRSPLPPQPGDMLITYADLTKSRRLLGYDPQVGFEEGIRRFVKWLRLKNPVH
jgi:UDP-glucuronate 4-epimerase